MSSAKRLDFLHIRIFHYHCSILILGISLVIEIHTNHLCLTPLQLSSVNSFLESINDYLKLKDEELALTISAQRVEGYEVEGINEEIDKVKYFLTPRLYILSVTKNNLYIDQSSTFWSTRPSLEAELI